jgi:DNA-binding GntR family transcriptional regulator
MEALKQLESEQLVVITPQVGCSIATPSIREISDHFRFMERAEGFIAELAATRGSKEEIENLAFISSQIGLLLSSELRPAHTVALYRKLNRDFHGCIHSMATSPELTTVVATLFDRNDFYIAISGGGQIFADSLEESQHEHDRILDAIAARDPARARAAIEYHIEMIRSRVVKHQTEED